MECMTLVLGVWMESSSCHRYSAPGDRALTGACVGCGFEWQVGVEVRKGRKVRGRAPVIEVDMVEHSDHCCPGTCPCLSLYQSSSYCKCSSCDSWLFLSLRADCVPRCVQRNWSRCCRGRHMGRVRRDLGLALKVDAFQQAIRLISADVMKVCC